MPNYEVRTNNDDSMLEAKVLMRVRSIMQLQKCSSFKDYTEPVFVRVLDAFGGEGVIWKEVKKRMKDFPAKIIVLGIDTLKYKRTQLTGNNTQFLRGLNIHYFDIIDLDAWGQPTDQLEILKERAYNGTVHCTFSITGRGRMTFKVYEACGYSPEMIEKAPMLLARSGINNFVQYLARAHSVREIVVAEKERRGRGNNSRKIYLYFIMKN
jgi:hypothetical protein